MFLSITRLRIRHWWTLPAFYWRSRKSERQAVRASGFLGGYILVDRRRAFWTMTGWKTEADMRAYRSADAHKVAMGKLAGWCDEASVTHYVADVFPKWEEAWEKLKEGRFTPVNHPSASQREKRIDAPRTQPLIQQALKAKIG